MYARHTYVAQALALAALLGACSAEPGADAAPAARFAEAPAASAAAPREVVVRTRDFAFDAPDTLQSGLTTFRLVNEGPDLHHVQLVRIEEGHTFDELMQHAASGGPPPKWAVEVGGPNPPAHGQQSNATLDLKPGSYALLCVIPTAAGELHVAKGMVKPLTVVPASGPPAALPPADVVMVLNDYSFMSTPEITSGRHTIRFENQAAQPHEVVIAKLAPGKTAQDMLVFLEKREGTPPGTLVGGVTGIARGEVNQATIDFEPGEYALICFVPDAGDGRPHFMHGMVRQITVT
jgi:plastocyanin